MRSTFSILDDVCLDCCDNIEDIKNIECSKNCVIKKLKFKLGTELKKYKS